jgi:2,4-dienoyl-CoA reductase (NADPH2)
VKVHLNTEVNRSLVETIKPDALVIAVGGMHDVPNLPGIDGPNVVTGRDLHKRLKAYLAVFGPQLLRWLTQYHLPMGKKVIVMGGGVHGCQVAEFLVKRGRQVTIVDTAETIGHGLLDVLIGPYLLHWLSRKGVVMVPGVRYERITNKGLEVTTKDGQSTTIYGDTIVTAIPLLPQDRLVQALGGSAREVHTIGDAREPNMIIDAIADGSRIGRII